MQIRSSKYTVYVLDTVVKSRQIQIYANESLVPWDELPKIFLDFSFNRYTYTYIKFF